MKEMFYDHNGKLSSMRIVWTIVVLLIVATWSYVSIKANSLQSFSTGDALWMSTIFGGKVFQSHFEKKLTDKIEESD